MEENIRETLRKQLFEVLAQAGSADDVEALLTDLCSPKEIEYMAQRLECAKMLMDGDTYENVIEKTEISSATLSRVSRCVRHGNGGYEIIFKKYLQEKKGS